MAYIGKKPTDVPLEASDISSTIITGQTALASEPADTDEFLISDAGTLKRIDYSLIKGGGITVADQFRLTTDLTSDASPITSNLERIDTSPQGTLGSGMSVSSGIFTFPSTGIYLVSFDAEFNAAGGGGDSIRVDLKSTTDNFSSVDNVIAKTRVGMSTSRSFFARCQSLVDVTDVSNIKVKFVLSSMDSSTTLEGDTAENLTTFTFIRLGDT